MSVMTVGGLVFSSDPRVQVILASDWSIGCNSVSDWSISLQVTVVESIMEAGLSVYQLDVTNVTRLDRGQYQCQVHNMCF